MPCGYGVLANAIEEEPENVLPQNDENFLHGVGSNPLANVREL